MNDMKLIMENWRRYSIQEENNYGSLYLFENDSIRETSFYERFNSLQESEGDLDVFLEEWEKSVDYTLESLNEQGIMQVDPILKVSVQAYMALQKGGKAVGKVLGVAKKLKAALEKKKKENPKLAKVGMFALDALVAGAAAVGVAAIIKSGADPSDVMSLANDVKDIAPDVAQSVADVAKNFNAETAADLISGNEDQLSQAAEQLSQVDNEAVQQIAQQAEKVADIIPDNPKDEYGDMFDQYMQDPTRPGASGEEVHDWWKQEVDKAVEAGQAPTDFLSGKKEHDWWKQGLDKAMEDIAASDKLAEENPDEWLKQEMDKAIKRRTGEMAAEVHHRAPLPSNIRLDAERDNEMWKSIMDLVRSDDPKDIPRLHQELADTDVDIRSLEAGLSDEDKRKLRKIARQATKWDNILVDWGELDEPIELPKGGLRSVGAEDKFAKYNSGDFAKDFDRYMQDQLEIKKTNPEVTAIEDPHEWWKQELDKEIQQQAPSREWEEKARNAIRKHRALDQRGRLLGRKAPFANIRRFFGALSKK